MQYTRCSADGKAQRRELASIREREVDFGQVPSKMESRNVPPGTLDSVECRSGRTLLEKTRLTVLIRLLILCDISPMAQFLVE
ncbi:MAG TPA: hypothetical protein PLY87_28225 [Planctomycetaceae bacterium]|nr:hypothetical protein [Planctomycetaceae bacterium]